MKKILFFLILAVLFSSHQVSFAQESSQSGDIRERVQEKVQAALNKPKAYLGTVTDIAETTLQLKNMKGEIKQVSAKNEDIDVVNIVSTSKTVNFSDIAIGDFVVAMGFVNGNSVLDTQRILVSTPLTTPDRKSYSVEIVSFAKNAGVARTIKDNQEISFTTSSTTRYQMVDEGEIIQAKATDLTTGKKAIITGLESEKGLALRRVLILQ